MFDEKPNPPACNVPFRKVDVGMLKALTQQGQERFQQPPEDRISTIPALRIRRILAPTDFSPCSEWAVDYSLALAKHFGATVILLHVVEPAVGVRGATITSPGVEESSRIMIDSGRDALAEVCRRRLGAGVAIETLVRMGRAYSEIADTAKALACDVIVMGTRGATRETSTLGSNADWVVHHAPCPVITTRP